MGIGAELLTVFGNVPGAGGASNVPLVAVLRDTLGDPNPDNDRLRYVWVLTSARPTLLQRGAASIPFFYWRPDLGKNADRTPSPVLDLGAPTRTVWTSLAGSATQVIALDANGTILRASSQRYRSNLLDHRRAHLMEGLAVLTQLENDAQAKAVLSDAERMEIESRLSLAGQILGGLVDDQKLPKAYLKQRSETEQTRGHNWELLRQRAEVNGLYFDPMGLDQTATHALLWVAKEEAVAPGAEKRPFDGRFLGIAKPFGDARLKKWTGYSARRYFDSDGREVDATTPGAHSVELIPLALYALEYPRVPLLLADFRAFRSPKNREMIRHAITDTISGVLGITRWGNWPYMAGAWGWNFVRTRQGDASDRVARLQAYSAVRQWLALDHSLDSDLRVELQKRLEVLGINPLEQSVFSEASIAERQYAALLKYADDPNGLARRLTRDRQAELTADHHSLQGRFGLSVAHIVTLGGYTHREQFDPVELTAELDRRRRAERQAQFLAMVAQSTPEIEVVWNPDQVQRAVDDLMETGLQDRSRQVLERILQETKDPETRALCAKALGAASVVAGE